MQGGLARSQQRGLQFGTRASVNEIGGGDVGQGLCRLQTRRLQWSGGVSVKVEGSELAVAVTKWKREDCRQPRLDRLLRELGEPDFFRGVLHAHRFTTRIGVHAGT